MKISDTRVLTGIVCIFVFFCFLSGAWAGQDKSHEPSCPDQNTLSNPARNALFCAQTKLNEKNPNQAKKILEEFLASHPEQDHPYLSFTLGSVCLDLNAMSRAKLMFENCVAQCPAFTAGWQNLGKVCYDLKDFTRSAQAFETIYELEKKPLYRFHAAVAWMEAKKKSRAFDHMMALVRESKNFPEEEWVKFLAHLSLDLKRSAQAVTVMESLLAKNDPPAYLFKLLTSLYLEQNSYEKAAHSLKAYSMIKELNLNEMRLMGDLLCSQGVPLKGADWYEKIYRQKPSLENCIRLVSSLHEGFAFERVISEAEKGIGVYPDSSDLWRLKGWAYYGQKSFREAAYCFSQAVKFNKEDTRSLFMSGFAAYRGGEKDKAKTALKLAASHKSYKSQANALIRQIDYEVRQQS